MKNKYDAIIIGAGISGLVAGTYLARHGAKALIVEKHRIAGGCYSSFARNGFVFDAGAQIIGSCGRQDILGSILAGLGVEADFVRLETTDLIHFPDETVPVAGDFRKFRSYLKERFATEGPGIDKFFELLVTAEGSSNILCIMKKYASSTYQELLDGFFKDGAIKSVFSAQAGYLGLPPKKLSAVSAIFLLKTYLVDGAYYPKGSSQALSDAIAKAFTASGGDLMLGAEATRIFLKGTEAVGIEAGGREIPSDFVVIASDIRRAYSKLLAQEQSKIDNNFRSKLASFKTGSSCCILYLGVSKDAGLEDAGGWYYPSRDINRDFDDLINIHIPTKYDKTLSESGDSIVIATFPFSYEQDERGAGRTEFKKRLMERLLSRVESRIPRIKGNVTFKEIATPLTIERYTSNSCGSLYGWAQSPDQTHKNCFPINSPFGGVFHAGHWTLPGGGVVAAAVSGVNAARRILKKAEFAKT